MKRNTRFSRRPVVEQEFFYCAPAALRVHLAGCFTRWQTNAIPMVKGDDTIWRCTVQLTPGTYHYRFIVDGDWRDDPECTLRISNEFGTANMLREVRPVN
jgi:1,4-alpha-glucan branching enzyme